VKRDLVIASLAALAIAALSIPGIAASLTPPLDAEIRSLLGQLHAARSNGTTAFDVAFGRDGKPIGGRVEIERQDYTVAIEADGRASVRMR
jgi:hypothetical protein